MKKILSAIALAMLCLNVHAGLIIKLKAGSDNEDATQRIQSAIDNAATAKVKSVIIRFARGTYHIASPGLRIGRQRREVGNARRYDSSANRQLFRHYG